MLLYTILISLQKTCGLTNHILEDAITVNVIEIHLYLIGKVKCLVNAFLINKKERKNGFE